MDGNVAAFRASLDKFKYNKASPRAAKQPASSPGPSLPPRPLKRRTSSSSVPASPHFSPGPSTSASEENNSVPAKKKKRKAARAYADPSVYAHLKPVSDHLATDLDLVCCGINPGIQTAVTGHHYAHATNHFYKTLHQSGWTDVLLPPSECATLPTQYSIGSTNLVPRASAEQSELSKEEMVACVPALLAKFLHFRPRAVAFVGIGIWEVVLKWLLEHLPLPVEPVDEDATPRKRKAKPKIVPGLQHLAFALQDTSVDDDSEKPQKRNERLLLFWAMPSSSARVVAFQLAEKVDLWSQMRAALRPEGDALSLERAQLEKDGWRIFEERALVAAIERATPVKEEQ